MISTTPAELDAVTKDAVARALWETEFDPSTLPPNVAAALASANNSADAFGERMRERLQYMLDTKPSFVPDYSARYGAFTDAAASLDARAAYAMTTLLGLDSSVGYQSLPDGVDLPFPASHAAQLEYQVGWHFLVGSVWGEDGNEYGLEMMWWQYAMLPPLTAARLGLSTIENQVTDLHIAVTRRGGNAYRGAPFVVAGTTGLLDFKTNPISMACGRNSLVSESSADIFPLRLQARNWDRGSSPGVEIGYDLRITSDRPVLLQYAHGCAPCCGKIGTLYYSVPHLQVAAGSTVRYEGRDIPITHGVMWMDHQWGTGFMPSGSPFVEVLRAASVVGEPGVGGWDFSAINLSDGWAITWSGLHSKDALPYLNQRGPTPPGVKTSVLGGTVMDPQGNQSIFKGELRVTEWVKAEHSSDPDYPASGVWYPNRWEFTLDSAALPPEHRSLAMVPIVPAQTGPFGAGQEYMEGATILLNAQGAEVGRGFGEATGYYRENDTTLRLAGLPVTPEMRKLVQRQEPTVAEKIVAEGYVLLNAAHLGELLTNCKKNGLGFSGG
ncbi:MAG TPA: lipocalin-like domain-containing protein [Candidatus Elarobacter sp.]|jgi:hypothetical protein